MRSTSVRDGLWAARWLVSAVNAGTFDIAEAKIQLGQISVAFELVGLDLGILHPEAQKLLDDL